MASAERTLVKSQPELWQLVDQRERMEGLASGLLGAAAEIEITEREPEARLAWHASAADEFASIELALEKKGWGTSVAIVAERDGVEPARLDGWIEAVLDELASTEKRPFRGLV
jgi:hypothetical protein